jgi:hypothetical protein
MSKIQNYQIKKKKYWEEKCKIPKSKLSLGSKIHNF